MNYLGVFVKQMIDRSRCAAGDTLAWEPVPARIVKIQTSSGSREQSTREDIATEFSPGA